MQTESDIASEVDGTLDAWRARALSVLLIVLSVRIVFPGLACLAGYGIVTPWPFRIVYAALCGVLVLDTLLFRADFRWRTVVMLVDVVVIGVLQLWMGQLAGDGRATLLLPPFLSLILIGPRAGWALLAVCAALFAGVLQLTGTEGAIVSAPPAEPGGSFRYWGLMWLVWVEQAVLLMLLLSLFVQRIRRTMINERQALRQLEKACAERQRLAREVDRLGAMERRRLGAELHDGLCQHLTAIHLNCATMEMRARDTGRIEATEFKRIHGLVEEAIDMAYDVSRGPVSGGPRPRRAGSGARTDVPQGAGTPWPCLHADGRSGADGGRPGVCAEPLPHRRRGRDQRREACEVYARDGRTETRVRSVRAVCDGQWLRTYGRGCLQGRFGPRHHGVPCGTHRRELGGRKRVRGGYRVLCRVPNRRETK